MLKKTANYWLPILVIALLVGGALLSLRLTEKYPTWDEFAPRWTAARLWLRQGVSPYSDQTHQETLNILSDYNLKASPQTQGYFTDLAFYLYFFLPFSLISFPVARAIWMTLVAASIVVSVYVSIDLAGLKLSVLAKLLFCLLVLAWYPSIRLILSASPLPPFILMVLAACAQAVKRKGTSAGVFFFLAAGMIPLSLLLVVFFVIWYATRRDNSLLSIYLVGIGFLLLSSLILFQNWLAEWFARLIALTQGLEWIDTPLMRLGALLPGAANQLSLILHVVVFIYLLVEWYGIPSLDTRGLLWKLMLTINLLYLFNLSSEIAYLILLLPALFTFFRYLMEKWQLFGKIIVWIAFIALILFYWSKSQPQPQWLFKEPSSIVLMLPAVTLIGLQWFRWWATKSPLARIKNQ